MSAEPTIRARARALFDVALQAADPGAAVRRSLGTVPLPAGRIWLLALGKAARAMADAALPMLAGRVADALVVTNAGNAAPLAGARVMVAGHPVPDAGGLAAADAVDAMLARVGPGDVVLVLISGGGSAMLPAPVTGITLSDKARATQAMLAGGLAIAEMNAVRQHLSRLKGGGLARAAAPAQVVALILSDVVGDDLRVVASGPTVAPVMARGEAAAMLRARGLWDAMPDAVRAVLSQEGEPAPVPPAENRLIGSNALALDAMRARKPDAVIWSHALEGDVGAAARWLAGRMRAAPPGGCIALCGGETTVLLRGKGKGGRNQELALRVAAEMAGVERAWAFLSGGTDGRDGPTDAAGGLVDGGTLARITAAGGDWQALLADNDSHRALSLADDLLVTGATGTNLADIQIVVMA
ncbi:MAG: glycerate kinase type-2 family protein [Pararhodobacter sp.]